MKSMVCPRTGNRICKCHEDEKANEKVDAIARMKNSKITGYEHINPSVIYFGSFLWICVLIGFKVTILMDTTWSNAHGTQSIASFAIGLNAWTFFWQTIDVVYFDFSNWIIIALHWVSQLSSIAFASVLLSSAGLVGNEKRLAVGILLVLGEALFLASQFSVTLEYLHKKHPHIEVSYQSGRSQTRNSIRNAF